jgi:hypothetical protein
MQNLVERIVPLVCMLRSQTMTKALDGSSAWFVMNGRKRLPFVLRHQPRAARRKKVQARRKRRVPRMTKYLPLCLSSLLPCLPSLKKHPRSFQQRGPSNYCGYTIPCLNINKIMFGKTFLVAAMFLGLVESLRVVVVVVLAKLLQVLPSQTKLGIVMPAKIQNEKGMAAATKWHTYSCKLQFHSKGFHSKRSRKRPSIDFNRSIRTSRLPRIRNLVVIVVRVA